MGLDFTNTLAGIATLAASAAVALIGRQIQSEFQDWTPRITDILVNHAVKRLPEGKRDRYYEEWSGHLAETPGEIGKWGVAIGCWRAAQRMQPTNPHRNFIDTLLIDGVLLTFAVQKWRDLPPTANGWIGGLQSKLLRRCISRELDRIIAIKGAPKKPPN